MLFIALRNLCNFDQMLFIAPLALYCIESIRSLFFGIAKVDIKIEMPSFEKFQMKRKTLQKPVISTEIDSFTQRDALILEKEAVLKEKGEAKEETVLSKEKAIKEKEYLRQNEEERARKVKQDLRKLMSQIGLKAKRKKRHHHSFSYIILFLTKTQCYCYLINGNL